MGRGPIPTHIPWLSSFKKRKGSSDKLQPWSLDALRSYQNPNVRRPSFWVSDFHHRYLITTGKDYEGRVPMSPPPGTYQNATHKQLPGELPQRDTRALPVRPRHPRVVFEESIEAMSSEARERSTKEWKQMKKAEEDYWEFFTKVQQVRAKWNRGKNNRSRGVYSPVIDATEIWG